MAPAEKTELKFLKNKAKKIYQKNGKSWPRTTDCRISGRLSENSLWKPTVSLAPPHKFSTLSLVLAKVAEVCARQSVATKVH